MSVPFLDVQSAYTELRADIDAAIARVLERGWFVLGQEVEAFEAAYADYVGADHCVAVNSGLDALQLGLQALDIGPGDDVIVPSHTFVATWLAVTEVGARPVPVEVDERTYCLDPARLDDAVTDRTRAVIPVHLYGQPAALGAVLDVAVDRGLMVFADAAQAHGARYRGQPVGDWCTSAWSFYPAKNLGALGDGGAITTDDAGLAHRLRLLRNYGSGAKYIHEVQGRNSRLDELQAAVLTVKLRHLDEWNERRRAIAARYLAELDDTSLILPMVDADTEPVWHLFVVQSAERDELVQHLSAHDIGTVVHYPVPPHRQPAYGLDIDLPVAERLADRVLSLPIGPHLSDDQVDDVIAAVVSFDKGRRLERASR